MKQFLVTTTLVISLLFNALTAQDSTKIDSNSLKNDTIKLDLNQSIQSALKIYRKIKEFKGLYNQIKLDHTSLLEIKGNYLNLGYIQQGFNTFEIGLSKGKRELFSITKLQEIHFNAQMLNNQGNRYFGLNIGISKSNLFFNRALEANWITNFNGNHAFIFRPEFGLTFFGTLNVNYGLNLTFNKNLSGFNSHVFHLRYTQQNFRSKIKEKIIQIKTTLERDRERLKTLGIQVPHIQF